MIEHELISQNQTYQAEETIQIELRLIGLPPRPTSWSTAVRWRPEVLAITWCRIQRVPNGEWEPWFESHAVSGPKITKAGQPFPSGAKYHERWGADREIELLIASTKPGES